MRRWVVLLAVLAAGVPAAGRSDRPPTPRPVAEAGNDLDVNYLQPWRDVPHHSQRGPEYQTRLNVHWPKGDGPLPCLIFVHGGGYGDGHKDIYGPGTGGGGALIDEAVRRGFVAVNVNYILGGEIFPQVFYDFRAAVRFLRANAARYRIDPARMGAWGHSAGGWLISSCGYADAGNFMIRGHSSTPNGWVPPLPAEAAAMKGDDERAKVLRTFTTRKQFLLPMDDPRPLYGELSSRLGALAFDFSQNTGAVSGDDPATITFVGAGGRSKLTDAFRQAGCELVQAVCLDPKLKGADVTHCPKFNGPSLADDGRTPVELKDRVFEFFQRELAADPRTASPEFRPNRRAFADRAQVEIVLPAGDIRAHYTVDGAEPTAASRPYDGPIEIDRTTTIKAVAFRGGWRPSGVATAVFFKGEPPPTITGLATLPKGKLGRAFSVQFAAAGDGPALWTAAVAFPSHAPAFAERMKQLNRKRPGDAGAMPLLGLELDAARGVLSGTPAVAGKYVLNVQAGLEFGRIADSRTYILEIEP